MSFSAEFSFFDADCNIIDDGAVTLLLRLANSGDTVRLDAGANEDTKDAIARKQTSGLIISIMSGGDRGPSSSHRTEHHESDGEWSMNSYAEPDGRAKNNGRKMKIKYAGESRKLQ